MVLGLDEQLIEAVKSCSLNETRIAIEKGADVNCFEIEWFNYSPLMRACAYGKQEIVSLLLANGASISQRSSYGETALHRCAWYGHLDIIHLLLSSKKNELNINAQDDDGNTPLHHASLNGYDKIVRVLIQYGACTSLKNNLKKCAEELSKNDFVRTAFEIL